MYALAPLAQSKLVGMRPLIPEKKPVKTCSLNDCEVAQCPIIRDLGTVKSFESNDTLFCELDVAQSYVMIESGVVRGCKVLSDGRRQICRFAFPGDLIALSSSGNFPYTAEAVTSVCAIVISRKRFEKSMSDTPCLQKLYLDSLLSELRETQGQMLVLGRMNAVERVANFLYELTRHTGTNPLVLPMSRVDIADYLGLTLETVSRVFSRLRRERKIELIGTNKVLIPNPANFVATCRQATV